MRFLGRKAELPNLLRGVAQLAARGARRPSAAPPTRRARRSRRRSRRARAELDAAELDARLAADVIDVTLPGSPAVAPGRIHLLTATRREIEDIFLGLGFRVMEGPETELVYYNFDALNFDETHPSRQATDTFYISDDVLLRVHTSPMQTRAMEMYPPPLYVVVPGRTYRRDNDATHTPQFNQVEGLAVDEDVTLGDLQGTLLAFAQRDLRRGAPRAPAPALLPVHRAERRVRRLVLQLQGRLPARTARAARSARARAGSRSSAPARSTRTCSSTCASTATTPSATRGSRSAWASSGSRCSSTACSDLRLFYDNDLRFLEQFG